MPTKNIVPRTGSEGEIGTSAKPWKTAHINEVTASIGVSGTFLYGDGTSIINVPADTLNEVVNAGDTTTNTINVGNLTSSAGVVTVGVHSTDVTASAGMVANYFVGALKGNADTATSATSATNADTVDTKHATDFTLDYVTSNGSTTTNDITTGDISFGAATATINDSSANTRFRITSTATAVKDQTGFTHITAESSSLSGKQTTISPNGTTSPKIVVDENKVNIPNQYLSVANMTASAGVVANYFIGDGTGITGVTGDWDGQHTGDAGITGSLAITGTISVSGSSKFGNLVTDNHIFTGSFHQTGSGTTSTFNDRIITSGSMKVTAPAGTSEVFRAEGTGGFVVNTDGNVDITAVGNDLTLDAGATATIKGSEIYLNTSGAPNDINAYGRLSASLGITGSSFVGDGSGLTNLPAASWDGQLNGDAGITGSLEVLGQISASLGITGSEVHCDELLTPVIRAATYRSGPGLPKEMELSSGKVNILNDLAVGTNSAPDIFVVDRSASFGYGKAGVGYDLADLPDYHFSVSGSTKLGELSTDLVEVTGTVEVIGGISSSLGITGSEVHTTTLYNTNFREPGGNLEMQIGVGSVYMLNDLRVGLNANPDTFVVDRNPGKVGVNYDLGDLPDAQFSVSGSTKLGELSTDLVEVTGTVEVIGDISASVNISASAFYGKVDVFQPGGGTYRPIFADVLDGEATLGVDASMAYNNALNTLYVANVQGTGLFTSVTSSIDLVTMDDTDEPATPSSAAHLYSKSGALYTKNDDGIESLIEQRLIAMSKVETVNDTAAAYDIKLFSATTSGEMEAMQWTIDGATRYAKVTFTAPANGQAKVCMSTFMKDAGGTSEIWFGLHNSSTSTATPTYGWFQVAKDSEAGEHDLESVDWVLTGLTAGASITVYVHAVCTLAGSQIKVGRASPNAWSNNDLPKPTTISVYTVPVTIDVNPT